jgi:hypothetical protein
MRRQWRGDPSVPRWLAELMRREEKALGIFKPAQQSKVAAARIKAARQLQAILGA